MKSKTVAKYIFFSIISIIPFITLFRYKTIVFSAYLFLGDWSNLPTLFSTWRVGNFGNPGTVWELYLYFFAYFFRLFTGENFHYFLIFISFFLLFFAMLFFSKFIQELFEDRIDNKVVLIGSLSYVYNIYIMINLSSAFVFIIPHTLLALQFYLLLKFLKGKNHWFVTGLLIGFTNFFAYSVNLVYAFVSLTLLLSYNLWYLFFISKFKNWKQNIYYYLIQGFTTLVVMIWWFVPFFIISISNISATGFVLQSEDFYNLDTTPVNLLRNFGDWAFFSGHDGVLYNEYSVVYKENILVIIISFALTILPVAITYFLLKKIKQKQDSLNLLYFLILLPLLMIFIGGTNEEWFSAELIKMFFQNIPLASIFRNTYKFASITTLIYSIFLTYILNYLLQKISLKYQENKNIFYLRLKYSIYLISIVFILINSFPLITNQIWKDRSIFKEIPSYWTDAAHYINNNTDKNYDRLALFPNQYFPVYLWNDNIQGIHPSFEESIIKNPIIRNTCVGCSQPYSSSLLAVLLENLDQENIFKLLGTLDIGYVLQRNDYVYEFYKNIQSPEEISKIMKNEDVKLIKTFEELDLYKIDEKLIYDKFYIPKKTVFSDNPQEPFVIYDILNDSQKNDIGFYIREDAKDKLSLSKNTVYIKNVFTGKNYFVKNNIMQDSILLPKDYLESKILLDLDEEIEKVPFIINNENLELSQTNKITLKSGLNTFSYKLKIDKKNILPNGDFENDDWGGVRNCREMSSDVILKKEIIKNQNGRYVKIGSDKDTACIVSEAIKPGIYESNEKYLLTFDYKISGKNNVYSFCILSKNGCVDEKMVNIEEDKKNKWQQHQSVFKMPTEDLNLSLFLYAPTAKDLESEISFDNISINKIENYDFEKILLHTDKNIIENNSIVSNFEKINNTHYKTKLSLSNQDNFVPLIFQESFYPLWELLVIDKNGDEILLNDNYIVEQYVANSYANGWILDVQKLCNDFDCGNLNLSVKFKAQDIFIKSSIFSGVGILIIIIFYIIYKLKTRKTKTKNEPTSTHPPKNTLNDLQEKLDKMEEPATDLHGLKVEIEDEKNKNSQKKEGHKNFKEENSKAETNQENSKEEIKQEPKKSNKQSKPEKIKRIKRVDLDGLKKTQSQNPKPASKPKIMSDRDFVLGKSDNDGKIDL
jgi:hypothetical protein